MKVLIINGSPRKGNTWKIVELIKEGMVRQGKVQFDEVMLGELEIPSCKGCFNCFIYGEDKCPHRDKIQPIVKKLIEADCLIMTSPVWALNVSGLLKNFIDHVAYFYHRPRFFEKKALVISSTAGGAAKKVTNYLYDTLKHWGYNKVYKLPMRCGTLEYKPSDKLKQKCYGIGKVFYNDVASKKLHSPTLKRIMFFNLWRALSLGWEDAEAADRRYWRETNLVKHPYYPKVTMGVGKRFMGNRFYGIFTRVFKIKGENL